MSTAELENQLAAKVRVLQIIVIALAIGPAVFLVMTQFMPARVAPAGQNQILTWLGLGMALSTIVVRLIVPNLMATAQRKKIAAGVGMSAARGGAAMEEPTDRSLTREKLALVYQTRTIVGCALLEGAAFFNTILCLIAPSPVSLGTAIVLILGVAAHFPTPGRVAQWIETQEQLITQDKLFG